jgi:hypothetical protein
LRFDPIRVDDPPAIANDSEPDDTNIGHCAVNLDLGDDVGTVQLISERRRTRGLSRRSGNAFLRRGAFVPLRQLGQAIQERDPQMSCPDPLTRKLVMLRPMQVCKLGLDPAGHLPEREGRPAPIEMSAIRKCREMWKPLCA